MEIAVKEGDRFEMGKPVVVIESMKMEFAVDAPISGTVCQFFCKEEATYPPDRYYLLFRKDENGEAAFVRVLGDIPSLLQRYASGELTPSLMVQKDMR